MNSDVPASAAEVASLVLRMEAELARLRQLPANSSYALHRARCVRRALAILAPPSDGSQPALPAPEVQDELSALLGSLAL